MNSIQWREIGKEKPKKKRKVEWGGMRLTMCTLNKPHDDAGEGSVCWWWWSEVLKNICIMSLSAAWVEETTMPFHERETVYCKAERKDKINHHHEYSCGCGEWRKIRGNINPHSWVYWVIHTIPRPSTLSTQHNPLHPHPPPNVFQSSNSHSHTKSHPLLILYGPHPPQAPVFSRVQTCKQASILSVWVWAPQLMSSWRKGLSIITSWVGIPIIRRALRRASCIAFTSSLELQ